MDTSIQTRPKLALFSAIVAIIFGSVTVFSGGSVIFFSEFARAAGDYVPVVVWFNFLAGFFYIIAGIGLFLWRRWGIVLSIAIAVLTLLVFAGLGIYILQGGAYEIRTVIAMVIRSVMWTGISVMTNLAWKRA